MSLPHSPSLSGPVPIYKPPVTEVVYATSEQATSRADSESTQIQTQSSDSNDSTGSPHLVYAQVDMKQTQVSPPASVEPVQYSSIAHKDKS